MGWRRTSSSAWVVLCECMIGALAVECGSSGGKAVLRAGLDSLDLSIGLISFDLTNLKHTAPPQGVHGHTRRTCTAPLPAPPFALARTISNKTAHT